MALTAGTRLGSYVIDAPLGEGGMGEVYRARDTKLNRDVAIKVLPALFAADPDRLARFEREAQTLAALNHPNIAAIYGVEANALVMELVDGEDLSAHITRGPIPLADALPIAVQIARALEAAHDQGIVHRDLKPANVKVRPDGTVKVLDFGLAKALGPDSSVVSAEAMHSPTLTARATAMGMVIGTAAYMAPEQAKGRPVDRRADVWAFGVVLYEMLTGRRAFRGEDVTEVMAAVIRDAPDFSVLPPATPASIRRLLRRCLEKDPRRRLRDMGDVGIELDDAGAEPAVDVPIAATPGRRSRGVSPPLFVAIAAALAVLAAGSTWWLVRPAVVDRPIVKFSLLLNEGQRLNSTVSTNLALSRDGRRLAYRADSGVWLRNFNEDQSRELVRAAGTGQWFSPRGDEVLFGTLKGLSRIAIGSGAAQEIVTSQGIAGADWGEDGSIVYSDQSRIYRLPADGGAPEILATADAGTTLMWPQVLPRKGGLLYTRIQTGVGPSTIVLKDGSARTVLSGGSGARYVATGHLLYGTERLMAVPFDLGRLAVTGQAVPMPEIVHVSNATHFPQVSFADNGTLAYVDGASVSPLRLVWADQQGKATPALAAPHNYSDPVLSPDGRRVALHLWEDDNDIWVADLTRGSLTRITFSPNEEETPVWSPDGHEVAYTSQKDPALRVLFRKSADGGASAAEKQVWTTTDHFHVNDWSPDGRTILVEAARTGTGDILAIDVQTGKDTPLLASRYTEGQARFSPDGKWLAYTSDESGRTEVYVQPYPALNARIAVSTGGGNEPVWSHDGRKLFFRSADNVMVAAVTPSMDFDLPRALFADRFTRTQGGLHTHFAVAADGRLLLIDKPEGGASNTRENISVVLNWSETLKLLAPPKR